MEPERIVSVVYEVQGQMGGMGLPRLYDLVFTDRRLVGIVKGDMPVVTGGFSAGMAEQALKDAKAHRVSYDTPMLDSLAVGHKAGFVVPYDQIKKAKLGGLVLKTLTLKFAGKEFYLQPPRERVDEVRALVAQYIPGAKV